MLLRGKPFTLFLWQVPALLPRDASAEWIREIHQQSGYALLALIGVHASAVIFHHYVLRDDALAAMLPMARRYRTLNQSV